MLNLSIVMHEIGQEPNSDKRVQVRTKEINGATVVYAYALCRTQMDSENAVEIRVETPADVCRWMSDYRYSEFWCAPAFGTRFADVPDETQMLLYQKKDGTYGILLPIVSDKMKCLLVGSKGEQPSDGPDGLTAYLFAWTPVHRVDCPAFVWAEGENPYRLIEQCTEAALKATGRVNAMRWDRRYPEIFEYLGWCSWDAMEIEVNEEGLLRKCAEFREKKIPVRWGIIDDMWAECRDFNEVPYADHAEEVTLQHSSPLYSFEAEPRRFPQGLKHCITKMKEDYGMKVGMWHPTTGYWYGIDEKSPLFRELRDDLIQTPIGSWIPSYELEKGFHFYNAFHDFLKECGTDFVKVDNQSMTRRFYKGLAPVGVCAKMEHQAIEASVGMHFDNALINCMGMASEDYWNRPVSAITRCSDDFKPENRPWFAKHITQCSYNSYAQGPMMWCDWDMWWTDDTQGPKNSVLRAISGGPIYVSDKIDRSRAEILLPLCLSDGRILRCDRPAAPTRESLMTDAVHEKKLFALQNMADDAGILAMFNLYEENIELRGSFSPSDVDGLVQDEEQKFLVWEYFSRTYTVMGAHDVQEVVLKDHDDFRLYNLIPIVNGFAPIGLVDKMIAPKTIKARIDEHVSLKESGTYAWYQDGEVHYKEV